MPNAREIQTRIKSVKNIGQVTRALEAVSASRSRKAQQQAISSRDYAQKAWEVLINIASQAGASANMHSLLKAHDGPDAPKAISILLISGDRGLAGAYNTNILRAATSFAEEFCGDDCEIRWITVGRRGRDSLLRQNQRIIAEFSMPAEPTIQACGPIAHTMIEEYLSDTVSHSFVAYTDFINTLAHKPSIVPLLPLSPIEDGSLLVQQYVREEPSATTEGREYIYEPSASAILDEVLPRFTELQIYQALLESQASEHSARMIAMRNASENAEALAGDLTLSYNKARQLAITSEILDIVGGVEALKQQAKDTVDSILAAESMDLV